MATAKVVGIPNGTNPDGTTKYDITRAIITSSIRSGVIKNVINDNLPETTHLKDCAVGVNLLKTMSDAKQQATFDKFVRGRVNPNVGGYYYAYAYQNEGYVEASGRIPLSKCSVSKVAGKRRAYVSMGVLCNGSTFRFFDVGVANDGQGWYPYVYGQKIYKAGNGGFVLNDGVRFSQGGTLTVKTKKDESGTILPSDGIVTLKLEADTYGDSDLVYFSYTCGYLTTTLTFSTPKGTMHSCSGGKPVVRFYRFMSLVPQKGFGEDDVADQSGLSATIDSLKLGTAIWDAAKIQHAYASQIENVKSLMVSTLTPDRISANQDYCYICHDTPTHPKA